MQVIRLDRVCMLQLCAVLLTWMLLPTSSYLRCNSRVASISSKLKMSTSTSFTDNARKRAVIVGATGYIGKYVTREAIKRGYNTTAIVRPGANVDSPYFKGAHIVYNDVTDLEQLKNCEAFAEKCDAVISCLASRSGVKEDSFKIDYQATSNVLNAAISGKGVDQFILLSAFCVRKPLLQFQKAKLVFEKELIEKQAKGDIAKYSIVRPTAFFKSVSGQFELLDKVIGIAFLKF